MTPFARFLLAMIIIVPLAFFGAAYLNGEDPAAMVKKYLPSSGAETSAPSNDNGTTTLEAEIEQLKREIRTKDARIRELEAEVEALKK
mgnify:CR=1 FL=1